MEQKIYEHTHEWEGLECALCGCIRLTDERKEQLKARIADLFDEFSVALDEAKTAMNELFDEAEDWN